MKHLIDRGEPDGIQNSSFIIAWVRKYGFKYGLPTQPHFPELRWSFCPSNCPSCPLPTSPSHQQSWKPGNSLAMAEPALIDLMRRRTGQNATPCGQVGPKLTTEKSPPSLARSVEKDRSVTHIKGRTIRECRPGLVVDLMRKYLLGINIDWGRLG